MRIPQQFECQIFRKIHKKVICKSSSSRLDTLPEFILRRIKLQDNARYTYHLIYLLDIIFISLQNYVWISNHNYSLFILLGICIYKLSQKRRRSKSHCDTQWLWIWSSYLECRMGEAIRNMNNQSKASWCLRGSNITTILFI